MNKDNLQRAVEIEKRIDVIEKDLRYADINNEYLHIAAVYEYEKINKHTHIIEIKDSQANVVAIVLRSLLEDELKELNKELETL
jgi:hypothetical protein